jgi:glyoxalase/bleomycin resistance protein/dioxygenase superfamily protein
MAAPFNIVAIDHIVLRAADPAALERFYLDVLGLTFETRQGKLAQLRAGCGLIDIVPADEPGQPVAHRAPVGLTSITCAYGLSRSTRRRLQTILPDKASPAVRRPCATVPKAKAHRSTCKIRKAMASSSKGRPSLGSNNEALTAWLPPTWTDSASPLSSTEIAPRSTTYEGGPYSGDSRRELQSLPFPSGTR